MPNILFVNLPICTWYKSIWYPLHVPICAHLSQIDITCYPNNPLSRHCLHVVQQLSWSTTVLFKHETLNSNTENLTASIYNGKSYPHNGTPWQ